MPSSFRDHHGPAPKKHHHHQRRSDDASARHAVASAALGSALAVVLWLVTSRDAWSDETPRSPYACASSRRTLEDVASAASAGAVRDALNATVTYPNATLRRARRVPHGFVRLVGTHHKTGTALMGDVFATLAKNFSYAFFDARAAEDELARRKVPLDAQRREELGKRFRCADIVFDYHFGASVPDYLLDGDATESESLLEATGASEYRVAHVVRDPLDVLVSGALYHRRAPPDEDWLTSARDELHGNTYAAFLAAATPAQAVEAEWRFSGDEIRMLALTHEACERDERCLNVRLEDFESSFQETIDRTLRFLGFPRARIAAMKALVAEHDVKTWSAAELANNEHYTRASSDRESFYRAVHEDVEASRIIEGVRRAMGYA